MIPAILNPATEQRLASVRQHLPHALLLEGVPGVGLGTIARELAHSHQAIFIQPVDAKGEPDSEAGTISVATIRALYEQTRAKQLSKQVYIIDNAERMSPGATAAFLKLLEEPTPQTHFILTSHAPLRLLPTIRSRVQSIVVEPLLDEQTKQLLDQLEVRDQKIATQLVYLGGGLPAELTRLTKDSDYFKQRALVMTDTRTLLTGTLYEKLLVVHAYHGDRLRALQLLGSALTVVRRSLSAKPQATLVRQLDTLLQTKERIEANGNTRLQLMAFVVQL